MDLELDGKTVLVTGSSRGIGEAIARRFAAERAIVVVHGRNAVQAQRVVDAIVAQGGRAHLVLGDLTRDDEVHRMVEQAQRQAGRIDIVVNNAGGSGGAKATWSETRVDTWAAAYDRNVLAALRVTTPLLPRMQEAGWGRVINISSLAATMPPPMGADYAACKAAMNAMTSSMAKAVAADGITVNAVSPGTIHSQTLDDRFREVALAQGVVAGNAPWKEVERAVLPMFAQVPLGRVGRLEEIADAVAFLASPRLGYITGINLRVDGGMSPGM
jgi:NAD(P)-dependent dehydrogenase (short-subunit alcohol dehydrogenase family)